MPATCVCLASGWWIAASCVLPCSARVSLTWESKQYAQRQFICSECSILKAEHKLRDGHCRCARLEVEAAHLRTRVQSAEAAGRASEEAAVALQGRLAALIDRQERTAARHAAVYQRLRSAHALDRGAAQSGCHRGCVLMSVQTGGPCMPCVPVAAKVPCECSESPKRPANHGDDWSMSDLSLPSDSIPCCVVAGPVSGSRAIGGALAAACRELRPSEIAAVYEDQREVRFSSATRRFLSYCV